MNGLVGGYLKIFSLSSSLCGKFAELLLEPQDLGVGEKLDIIFSKM